MKRENNFNGKLPWAMSLSIAWMLTGCGQAKKPTTEATLPTLPVRVAKAESKGYPAMEEVVGTVRARVRASIEAKVSGRIEQLPVVAGQTVAKGDLLALLDVQEVQAELEQAQAIRQLAELEMKRQADLLSRQATTQQEFDRMQTQLRVANASVKKVETLLAYGRVTAPFGGVISRKLTEVGDLATPGRALLELEDPATLRFEGDVPEALIDRIKSGARLAVRLASLSQPLEGTVTEIDPVADPASRTSRIKLDLPSVAGLRSGMFGRVAVPLGEQEKLRVPAAALVTRGQMEMVFVAAQQKAHMRLVKSGRFIGGEVELLAGLEAGEEVVVEGAATLADQQPITVKP